MEQILITVWAGGGLELMSCKAAVLLIHKSFKQVFFMNYSEVCGGVVSQNKQKLK